MSKLVFLDTNVLGMVTNPKNTNPICQQCKEWLDELPLKGYQIILPEIADYEVRRELLRAGKTSGIKRLDQLKQAITYLPITTSVILLAANFWAEVRNTGNPTADSKSLDGDVILAAQAKIEELKGHQVTIATTNVKHLSLFIDARAWQNIN